jgi:hypothetical protein
MLRYAIEKMSDAERKEWMSIPQTFTPAKVSRTNRFAGIPVSHLLCTTDKIDLTIGRQDSLKDETLSIV